MLAALLVFLAAAAWAWIVTACFFHVDSERNLHVAVGTRDSHILVWTKWLWDYLRRSQEPGQCVMLSVRLLSLKGHAGCSMTNSG